MNVRLKFRDEDAIHIMMLTNGEPNGRTLTIRPGERFHGWKHGRLKKMGEGDHELVSKATKRSREHVKPLIGAV